FEDKESAPPFIFVYVHDVPLFTEVYIPVLPAPNILLPAWTNDHTPDNANCSPTSQFAPLSCEYQIKLSSDTIIDVLFANRVLGFSIGVFCCIHVLPESFDLYIPDSL